LICSFNFLIFLAVCLNISTVINIKILTNSNQQTQSCKFTSHISAFLSVVLITEMLEICIQTSYDQNVQLILKNYLPVVYGTTLTDMKHHYGPHASDHMPWISNDMINIYIDQSYYSQQQKSRLLLNHITFSLSPKRHFHWMVNTG
jgi:hypothetical protein